jgi:hypothetical protein
MTYPPIEDARKIAEWMFPTFVEWNGCVLVSSYAPSSEDERPSPDGGLFERRIRQWRSRSAIEWNENHTHVFDLVEHDEDIWDKKRSRFRRRHPHFKLADEIGRLMARSWTAQLMLDFPQYDFIVHYSSCDNPVVRFHKIHPGESPYFDGPVDSREETVYDTRALRHR